MEIIAKVDLWDEKGTKFDKYRMTLKDSQALLREASKTGFNFRQLVLLRKEVEVGEVRQSEERSEELATVSLKTKTARTRTSVQDAPPP